MPMYNPAHPGEILKEVILDDLDLSVTETAVKLGVSRKTLSSITNAHSAVTADMALKLEAVFKKPNAEHWMRLQVQYDLWQARQRLEAA